MWKTLGLMFAVIYMASFCDANTIDTEIMLDTDIQPVVVTTCDILNRSGITCTGCETLTRCVLMVNQWQSYEVDKCDTDEKMFCNSIEQRCSMSTGPCNQANFTCNEEGYFPNPYSCQEYFYCLNTGTSFMPIKRECAPGYAYNAKTTTCTLSIQDQVCSALQWNCSYPGEIAAWPGTEDIFYICQRHPERNELLPDVHLCINYQIFDGQNCVNR